MKKLILMFIAGVATATTLMAQNFEIPEIVNEKLEAEALDLSITPDYEEVDLSEENYYEYVYRQGGTDTIIGFVWNKDTQSWKKHDRIIKIYDANEQVVEKFYQYLNPNHGWINGLHFTYTYDDAGNRTEKTVQIWRRINQEWVNHFHRSNVFNSFNKLIKATTQRWSIDSAIWINRHNRSFYYNEDTLKADTIKVWGKYMQTWKYKKMHKFHYDIDGNLKARMAFQWKHSSNIWALDHRTLFGYNNDGWLKGVKIQAYKPIHQVWINKARHAFEYDADGNRTLNLKEIWEKHDWIGVEMRLFQYNINDNLTQAVFKAKKPWHPTWHNLKKVNLAHDDNGNIVKKLVQNWSEYFQMWYNHRLWKMIISAKSGYAGIDDLNNNTEKIEISFANPYTKGIPVTISGLQPGQYQVHVVDLSGKIVFKTEIESNAEVFINDDLHKGVYIISLVKNNQLISKQKMIVAN